MNQTKLTLAVIGGVIGLAALALAYLDWQAFAAKTAALEGDADEGTDGLETVVERAKTISRKPIYPCAASLSALESNRTIVAAWQAEAVKLASRGDKVFAKTTPPAFKTFLVADAKRLSALPGSVNGLLAKPDFAFGPFKEYITGGAMPPAAQLVEFQRKWDDVATLTEMLASCGIAELVDVQFAAKDEKKASEEEERQKSRSSKKGSKNAKAAQAPSIAPSAFSYVFTFAAKPTAFTKAVNALETCERFVAVDGFTFSRPKDVIAEALGGDDKKAAAQGSSHRDRRRRVVAVEEKKDDDSKKGGVITDPVLDAPLTVVMTVTVYDFRSLEDENAADKAVGEKTEEVKK